MADPTPGYHFGSMQSVWIKQESTTSSSAPPLSVAAGSVASIPASPVYLGQTNSPSLRIPYNRTQGFSVGAQTSLYQAPGPRGAIPVDVAVKLGTSTIALLVDLLPSDATGATGIGGTADWAIYVNTDNSSGTGRMRVIRFCKLQRYVFNDIKGQEPTVNLTFLGLIEQAGTVLNPVPADLLVGVPLQFTNTTSLTIASTSTDNYRRVCSGITMTLDIDLEEKGVNNDLGDNDITSLKPLGLYPRRRVATARLNFEKDIPNTLYNSAATKTFWGDVVATMTNAAASTVGSGAIGISHTLTAAGLVMRDQGAIEQNAQLGFSVDLTGTDLTSAAV